MRRLLTSIFVLTVSLSVYGQEAQPKEIRGLAPRPNPTDYQAQAKAAAVTIAAEFMGHSVPTSQGNLSTEEYVIIETALYGAPDTHLKLALEDFSLRINGKKTPLSALPFGVIFTTLKDPEWEPPVPAQSSGKSKTSLTGGGGGGGGGEPPPPPPKIEIPMEMRRAMQQRVQKAALPEGDRALPVAGLLFFQYSGKTQGLRSIELLYAGPAGKATLPLH
jgi:hypothetical protein